MPTTLLSAEAQGILSAEAYAKINLRLTVGEKRPDGYHEIESVMQKVSLCDLVTVELFGQAEQAEQAAPAEEGTRRIRVSCTDPAVPTDGRNIVWGCAEAFFSAFGIEAYDIRIHIEKHIPSAAGLAGGSADGAATLRLLNRLFGIHACADTLCEIGATVGADIPFCTSEQKIALCRGRGEILTPFPPVAPACAALIVKPRALSVPTGEAYRLLDENPPLPDPVRDEGTARLERELAAGMIPVSLYNDFERIALKTREVFDIKDKLLEAGAVSALMSGSGPSVYGLFPSLTAAEDARAFFTDGGLDVFAASLL